MITPSRHRPALPLTTALAIRAAQDHRVGPLGTLLTAATRSLSLTALTQQQAVLAFWDRRYQRYDALAQITLQHWLNHEALLIESARLLTGVSSRPRSFADPIYRLMDFPISGRSQGSTLLATETIRIPIAVSLLLATLLGGGGGGAGAAAAGDGGAAGGGAELIWRYPLVVVPGTEYAVTLGPGGAGGAGAGAINRDRMVVGAGLGSGSPAFIDRAETYVNIRSAASPFFLALRLPGAQRDGQSLDSDGGLSRQAAFFCTSKPCKRLGWGRL